MRRSRVGAVFAFVAMAALVGCSGGDGNTGDVSGTVSYDGKPIEDGLINFLSADGKGQTASAPIKDGKYSISKVSVGATKVQIRGSKVTGKKKMYDTPESPEVPIVAELLPAKYHDKTELTFEVKRGSNEKDWDLAK